MIVNNITLRSNLANLNGESFINYGEYQKIKTQSEALDHKIKIRRDYEQSYTQMKLSQLDYEIEEIKSQNQLANLRNEELLNSIQKNMYAFYETNKVSSYSKGLKDKEVQKYSDYLSYQVNNIKNEFQQKLLIRQNELKGLTVILEKQNSHNEQILKIENDYSNRLAKVNGDLGIKIKSLVERNVQLEEDRQKALENYKHIEETTRENFFQMLNLNKESKITPEKEETILSFTKQTKEIAVEVEVEVEVNSKLKENENMNHSPADKEINLKDKSLDESTSNIKIKESTKLKKEVIKRFSHQEGILDQIRKKKLAEKMGQTQTTKMNDASINNLEKVSDRPSQIKSEELKSIIKILDNKKEEHKIIVRENEKVKVNDSRNLIVTHEELNEKLTFSNEDQPKTTVVELNTSSPEYLLKEKPDLKHVPTDFKIRVAKRIIFQIEKNIKSVKPNNPSHYVYQSKHLFSNSKQTQKSKFYDILSIILDNSNKEFPNVANDNLINLLLEILNSNKSNNLVKENLSNNNYNEVILSRDLDHNTSILFDLTVEHMKKVVLEKKTSPNMAANVLASSLINFERDQRMLSNLVAVLERKLSQRSNASSLGMNTGFAGGFNSTNTLIFRT